MLPGSFLCLSISAPSALIGICGALRGKRPGHRLSHGNRAQMSLHRRLALNDWWSWRVQAGILRQVDVTRAVHTRHRDWMQDTDTSSLKRQWCGHWNLVSSTLGSQLSAFSLFVFVAPGTALPLCLLPLVLQAVPSIRKEGTGKARKHKTRTAPKRKQGWQLV